MYAIRKDSIVPRIFCKNLRETGRDRAILQIYFKAKTLSSGTAKVKVTVSQM